MGRAGSSGVARCAICLVLRMPTYSDQTIEATEHLHTLTCKIRGATAYISTIQVTSPLEYIERASGMTTSDLSLCK